MKTHLMLHHSLTKDSKTVSAQAIRRYHVDTLGWRDIGYHLLIEEIVGRYELIVGRSLLAKAAAAYQQGMNSRAIHVCFIGNYDEAPPPVTMLKFAAPHLADVCDLAGISLDREHVMGHCDVAPKTCPGQQFDIPRLISLMKGA